MVLWRHTRPSKTNSKKRCPFHHESVSHSIMSFTQSCPTLCSPMDCSLLGSSVHGVFQIRILEWVAISFSRGPSQLRYQPCISCLWHWWVCSWPPVPPIMGDWNAKVESQEVPRVTSKSGLGVQNEVGPRIIEFCQKKQTGHSKHLVPTAQKTTVHMDITKWSVSKSDWLCSLKPKMEKLCTVSKTRPGADCGLYHELLIAKFRLKLKKVGKALGHSGMT